MRDLIELGADFSAGPLSIASRNFATYGVTPASVFDACALARSDGQGFAAPTEAPPVSTVAALVRRAFGARITDMTRPMNANYGARYSWHKYGQAVDFVPAGGVNSINRGQIRTLMGQSGFRVIELLGPGDAGHSNHWHVAFARPGQVTDRIRPVEQDQGWIVYGAQRGDLNSSASLGREAVTSGNVTFISAVSARSAVSAHDGPPQWDVFGRAEWRAAQGGGS